MNETVIEQLKTNKELEPYFLWFLKTNLMLPKVINLVMRMGNVNDINGLEIICNHEKSSKALSGALANYVTKQELNIVCSKVCQHYLEKLGAYHIKKLAPELLILPSFAKN